MKIDHYLPFIRPELHQKIQAVQLNMENSHIVNTGIVFVLKALLINGQSIFGIVSFLITSRLSLAIGLTCDSGG